MTEFGHSKAAADVVGFRERDPLVVMSLGAQVLDGAPPEVEVHAQLNGQRVVEDAERFEERGPFQSVVHGGTRPCF